MQKIAHAAVSALIGFGIVYGIGVAPAYAEPRDVGTAIEDSSGTHSGGVKHEDSSGTGGPDYTQSSPKPSRADYDTALEYRVAVTGWEAEERARKANLGLSKGR